MVQKQKPIDNRNYQPLIPFIFTVIYDPFLKRSKEGWCMGYLRVLLCVFFFPLCAAVDFSSKDVIKDRAAEGKRVLDLCARFAKFYDLAPDETYRDITQELLASPDTTDVHKALIQKDERRIVVFRYPSDGFEVKGYLSFVPSYSESPLLVFLRGGNCILGLMNPANDFSLMKNYTVLGTAYRGGISQGQDEFGGEEVNDVKNLIAHIPQLQADLEIDLQPSKKYILGGSRGGMEMFLALERSTFLQSYFDKAVSLSGPTDLRLTIKYRADMKNMFIRAFGLRLGENEEEWLDRRSPLKHAHLLRKDLPILLIQGTEDHRTHLDHGRHMLNQLTQQGNQVTYWEIEGATHCLSNIPNRTEKIAAWFDSNAAG